MNSILSDRNNYRIDGNTVFIKCDNVNELYTKLSHDVKHNEIYMWKPIGVVLKQHGNVNYVCGATESISESKVELATNLKKLILLEQQDFSNWVLGGEHFNEFYNSQQEEYDHAIAKGNTDAKFENQNGFVTWSHDHYSVFRCPSPSELADNRCAKVGKNKNDYLLTKPAIKIYSDDMVYRHRDEIGVDEQPKFANRHTYVCTELSYRTYTEELFDVICIRNKGSISFAEAADHFTSRINVFAFDTTFTLSNCVNIRFSENHGSGELEIYINGDYSPEGIIKVLIDNYKEK